MNEILLEIARAVGYFFINPILYVTILISILIGYRRVKKERASFHTRILNGWSESTSLLIEGLLYSLIISIISLSIGLTMPVQLLYVVTIVCFLSLLTYVFHLLSPIIYFTIGYLILIVIEKQNWTFQILDIPFSGVIIDDGVLITVPILVGLLLIAEGLLIRKKGAKFASPRFERSKRGLQAVAFLSKKVWILPLFIVIPGETISAYFPYWPQFSLGATEFSIVIFPIVIGFQQMARSTLPIYLYPKLGRAVVLLGEIVVVAGLVAYFLPIIGLYTLIIGAICRIVIAVYFINRERKDLYAVSPKSNGVMIAAVLPNSPAEKMGLLTGEIIRKVNGTEVRTEQELYEALQINAAHCKLEVLDHKNELRLTQHVVHSKDHYQIGLLLTE